MAKLKKGKWTPEETAHVQDVPKDAKLRKTLTKIATKLNRSYPTVYQKWYSEFMKGGSTTVGKTNAKDVPAMDLTFDADYAGKNTNIDETEKLSFEKGLAAGIPKLEPFKGAILVPTRLEKVAKEYLTKHHPKMVFTFVSITGNGKQKRLMRKI
jgi:hypothetical protein